MCRNCTFALLIILLCTLVAFPAQALVQRAFVSGKGDNANVAANCAVLTPCKTFAAAVTVVAPNGEVVALDTAPYGSVTLTQSISLTAAPGVYAGISVFAGSGITINGAGINVVLRGLTINGQGGLNGIIMTAGAILSVENCVIANMGASGIVVNTGTDAIVRVTDTTIRDILGPGISLQDGAHATITRTMISGNAASGVSVTGSAANSLTTADIADSTIDGNVIGVSALSQPLASAVLRVSVRDSRIVGSLASGVSAQSTANASVTFSASNNMISNNGTGILAEGMGAKVWASGNTVSDNVGQGLRTNASGVIESAGNNAVNNNGLADSAVTTLATK